MTSSRDLRSRVTDIVTCPICMELFDNPKSLPCLHAFCLKCLQSHFKDSPPEDEEVCPVCRTKFKIPLKGLNGLVHHFFIETLVDARKISTEAAAGDVPCEVGRDLASGLIKTRGGMCEKHERDEVRLYCFDCKTNICLVCSAVEHDQHKRQEIGKVAEACVKQIDEDVKPVSQRVSEAHKELERLNDEMSKLLADIDEAGVKIEQKADELKRLIDRHASVLLSQLQSVKTETCKEIDSHRGRVELAILAMESFNTYCLELKSKGKPSDITRAANDLHVRATELLQTDVTLDGYCAPDVTFSPMNIDELMARQNIVGGVKSKTSAGAAVRKGRRIVRRRQPAGNLATTATQTTPGLAHQ